MWRFDVFASLPGADELKGFVVLRSRLLCIDIIMNTTSQEGELFGSGMPLIE